MARSKGKDTSLENFGTINLTTTTIRRIDDSAPAIAGVLGYPDTANIYRLISADCADTRDIIIDFYRDRDDKFGLSKSLQVPPALRTIRISLVIIAVNHYDQFSR
ncbi:hypothetical protein PENFLA_c092G03122 [Penicillium flavigenum]|uniref:Uncharacterized protein n=1 Tax=Penicillium flavigenum TaxID=254877 RepID=A0A1V6S7S1_9EURO|nr:hypothetical protein PENFLA_c092G03122 [Penicillium flavigenum]